MAIIDTATLAKNIVEMLEKTVENWLPIEKESELIDNVKELLDYENRSRSFNPSKRVKRLTGYRTNRRK